MILKILAGIVLVFWVGWVLRSAFLARRLLVIETSRGRRVRARGRVPLEVVSEIEDVLERARATAVLSVRLDGRDGVCVVVDRGTLDDGALQRVRNVVGRFPRARLTGGRSFRR